MLTANDIGDGKVDYESARRTTDEAFHLLTFKSRPNRGDILITKDGTLGRVAVHDGRKACINQSVALLRGNARLIFVPFLAACLSSRPYQDRMLFEAGGTTIKHIYISRLSKMPIAVPPLREQEDIIEGMSGRTIQMEDLLDEARSAIVLLRERRAALISAAVTGQIDVRGLAEQKAA